MPARILVLLSSNGPDDVKEGLPYGWWLPEFAHPYKVFKDAGAEVTVASSKGGKTFVAPPSIDAHADDAISIDFLHHNAGVWEQTAKAEDFLGKSVEFDAIFVPGGVGPMHDLIDHKPSQELILEFHRQNKAVSAVCHGQAAFLNIRLDNGDLLLANKHLTAFAASDEVMAGTSDLLPFTLETRLRAVPGVQFSKAEAPLGEKVVVDGNLLTGQNPASAVKLGEEILYFINEKA